MSTLQRISLLAFFAFTIVVIFLLKMVLTPFFLAALLAYLGDPWVDRLVYLKVPRTLAAMLVFLLIVIVVVGLILLLVPMLERQIVLFISRLPHMLDWLQSAAVPWLSHELSIPATIDVAGVNDIIKQHWQQAGSFAVVIWKTILYSGFAILNFIISLVLVPVVTFYLLRDWDGVISGCQKLLPRTVEPTISMLAKRCDEVVAAFFRGQLLVMLGLAIIYSFGLWAIGLELALLIGFIVGLVSIVPYLGFIIGIVAASLAAIFQFHDAIHLLYVVIIFGIGQLAESMLLTPLLVGDKIGLHPVLVIFAVLAGGELFGFLGILLALPVAAVIMVMVRYMREKYLESDLYVETSEVG